ncbi:hypothetical protein WG922_21530 [Ramlibacter sp. AN1015]|uniref:hypothetical protein n=1 Tax=Ramlibacter sp. AN1015 TaxID=3133428 RepID=UPI0030C14924
MDDSTARAEKASTTPALSEDDVNWIVNNLGELGVMIHGQAFFLYKGRSLVYESGTHDDGAPMLYRMVGKREFGETCWPLKWVVEGRRQARYTEELVFTPGLSFGSPSDGAWRPLGPAPSTGVDTEPHGQNVPCIP